MNLIQTCDLTVSIADWTICSDMNLEVQPGQRWGLMGGNGAGKTTLLHTLAGIRPPTAGTVALLGEDIHLLSRLQVAQNLGLLLQDASDPFPATVLETALLGRHPYMKPWQWESDTDRVIALAALECVELDVYAERMIDSLSGGERRRLAIATLLTQQPTVLLLDEPTNHLDPYFQIKLLTLLAERVQPQASDLCQFQHQHLHQLNHQQGGLIMALHDINLAARFCSHLLLLLPDGEVLTGTCDSLLDTEVLARLYGYPMVRIESDQGRAFLPQ